MFWMSNATELLNFFQVKVETMEKEWEFEGESDAMTDKTIKIFRTYDFQINYYRNLAMLDVEIKVDTKSLNLMIVLSFL